MSAANTARHLLRSGRPAPRHLPMQLLDLARLTSASLALPSRGSMCTRHHDA